MKLTVVYHFHSSSSIDGQFIPASYRVIYFFTDQGFIPDDQLKELSKSVPEARHELLTFMNLDDLKIFALRVAQEFETNQVRLISGQDYNIGLDGAKDLKSFHEIFEKFGELIEDEHAPKKGGIFKKLFS